MVFTRLMTQVQPTNGSKVGRPASQARRFECVLLGLATLLASGSSAHAQRADAATDLVFSSPSSTVRVKACDDFATNVLQDPWDMDKNRDIANYVSGDINGLTNISFSGGAFSFLTTTAFGSSFYLFSPQIRDTTLVGGRWGQDLNFDATKAAKYKRFAMRMSTNTLDAGGGFKLVLNRSVDYVPNRTVSSFISTKTGWNTYRVDMSALPVSTSESSNMSPWLNGSITGFSILPTSKANANIAVDFIRLEDPTSCPSVTTEFTATADSVGNLYNLYLDEDSDPFNGYSKKIAEAQSATGAASQTFTVDGVQPGYNYKVVGVLHSDYAMLERDNGWDMSDSEDISLTAGVANTSFAGGVFSGTATSSAPAIYITIPSDKPVTASKYRYLSFKLTRSQNAAFAIFFTSSTAGARDLLIDPNIYDADGDGVYQIDMAQVAGWSGNITEFILRPVTAVGATFSLDFVTLRNQGYVTALTSGTVTSAGGAIAVNVPPVIDILRPRERGGEALQAWNMNPDDIIIASNVRTDTDPKYPVEKYTTWLPDVRSYEGVRGDLYKGTNILGNDDPNEYFTFPYTKDTTLIDAAVYKNFVIKANIDHALDVCLGSIIKPVWLNEDDTFTDTQAAIAIYDRWTTSRWYEYDFDLTKMALLDTSNHRWTGIKKGLRVDPHEFARDTCGADGKPTGNPTSTSYYYDYAFLTKDVTSAGSTTLVYNASDPDDTATLDFYLSPNPDGTGGTKVATALSENERVFVLDTSSVADGTYYLRADVSDGLNTNSRVAKGRFVVSKAGTVSSSAPILSLDSPTEGASVCDSMQVKGFSLMTDKLEWVSAVEVRADGRLIDVIEPGEYSPAAILQYAPQSTHSSTSGFNRLIDVSALSAGAHTITFKAFSPDGLSTTKTVTVTKAGAGCANPIVDPDPSGSPLPPDNSVAPAPTPTPISSPGGKPVVKGRHTKAGALTITISQSGSATCSLSLSAGATASKLSSIVTGAKGNAAGTVTFSAAKLTVNNKKVPAFFFQASRTCDGATTTSAATRVKFVTAKGSLGSAAKVLGALKKLKAASRRTSR